MTQAERLARDPERARRHAADQSEYNEYANRRQEIRHLEGKIGNMQIGDLKLNDLLYVIATIPADSTLAELYAFYSQERLDRLTRIAYR